MRPPRSMSAAAPIALALISGLSCTLALSGCYVEEEAPARQSAAPPPAAEDTETAEAPVSATTTGGRSTLGKAKRTAKDTVGALEQHDADIQKELDDQ